MPNMALFDYEAVAREAGISDEDLELIKNAVREEFPNDEMMWEPHVMRACSAIRDGVASMAGVIDRRAA